MPRQAKYAGRGDGPDPDAGVAQLAARDEAGPRDVPQVNPGRRAILPLSRLAPDRRGQERRAVVQRVGHLRQLVLGHGLVGAESEGELCDVEGKYYI